MKNILLIFFNFLLTTLAFTQAPISQQQIDKLDAYIQKAMEQWATPGLAIVVCKGDKVLLQKGYGVRELGKPDKVDTQTLFACASTTKAMTAAALGMLVDEGKVRWNDKVIQHLPDFMLADPYMTRETTVRDLLTHNAGMGNADWLWGYTDNNQKQILELFGKIQPAYSMRSSFIYQNIMYLVAGKVIERVSGMTWRDFVQKRIFTPLSMTRTYPTLAASQVESNRSKPHTYLKNDITPIQDSNADEIDAAGSVWSCVEDMSKWMRFLLDSGRVNGRTLLSKTTWAELFRPQVIVTPAGFYPTAQLTKPNWTTYGLGWFQHDYKGRMVHFHTGSLAGTVAIHGLLPAEKVGVYVFGNLDHTEVRHALMYRVFDMFLNEKERDWSTDFKKLYDDISNQAVAYRQNRDNQRVLNTKTSLPINQYEGTYFDAVFGRVVVQLRDNVLYAKWNSKLTSALEHWHFDTFKGTYNVDWILPQLMTFYLDDSGKVARLQVGNQVFTKK